MDQLIERFLKRIGVEDLTPFASSYFDLLTQEKDFNRILAVIHCPTLLPWQTYADLFGKVEKIKADKGGFETRLSFEYDDEKEGLDKFIDSYIALTDAYDLGDYTFDKPTNTLIFTYDSEERKETVKEETGRLAQALRAISCDLKIAVRQKVTDPTLVNDAQAAPANDEGLDVAQLQDEASFPDDDDRPDDYDDEDEDEDEESQPNAVVAEDEKALELKRQESIRKAIKIANATRGRMRTDSQQRDEDDRSYYPAMLKDIDNLKKVMVTGKIFKHDQRVSKKGKAFLLFEYTDNTSSIGSMIFESKRYPVSFMDKLAVGTKIKVKGTVETDAYTHHLTIVPDKIEILPPDPSREDPSLDKRVELHLHTNMSALDGIASITQYATLAKSFGMKAIGITDHGVVQAFPEAQKISKKLGIKICYGCELYMVDSHLDICINTKDIDLDHADYVVFDLETTGLSARYDRIIEFGATKYSHGQETDNLDFFINPDRKLRDVIKNKTNITQEMVDSGRPIKEALKTILDYFGSAVIIDHNAAFDIGFLNEALKNNGLPQITNPIIDTLPLSRYMFPKQRSHTLEAVARTLGINYDETKVHRAIYDAKVLEAVYIGILSKISETNPNPNMKDLEDLTSNDVILTARPKHVCVYAKNEQGLKDLYRIISLSSTTYLSDVPHTPRALIDQYRANLLVGSACFNGEVFDSALTKSEDVLKKVMAWYDYIEVQPPACYSWLINDGQISSEDNLEMILKDLIKAAKDINKPVVATGDCHYLNPDDKIYRDIYIFAKGLKGAQHPLNPYRRKSQKPYPNPDQNFLSTQEMKDAFKFLDDDKLVDEIVVRNSNAIADQLSEIKPTKDRLYPPFIKDCDTNLIKLVFDTAHKLYGDPLPEPIQTRLDKELKGIGTNGYYVIYWIASVLVRQVNAAGHLVGSRGSVGSSLVATMSGITEVNPLPPYWLCPNPACKDLIWADTNVYSDGFDLPDKDCPKCGTPMKKDGHNIPFETFLGFHGDKVPDIDLNFPSDFQSTAHEMTRKLMGADNVYKAGTIQTTEEKNAIGYVKGYFENQNIDPKTIRPAEIDRLAAGCVGVKRTTGQHPGGIIVIPNNMSVFDFTPYQYPANSEDASWKTTHYDFHAIHDNVLKFDELGHVDPYAIKMMCDMADIDWKSIPFDDPATLSLFWSTKALKLKRNILNNKTGTLGLPEFGTTLAMRILVESKPRGFGDLVRVSGLSHGTNVFSGNAEDMILSGKATLRDVICSRDDIMLELHRKWGVPSDKAFTIMELVRHGQFTKPGFEQKTNDALAVFKQYKVPQEYVDSCAKIKYLFPKGHACAYVMMAVRVAWFKVHHPEVYYAVYYTLRCDAYDLRIMQAGQEAAIRWLRSYQAKKEQKIHVENKEDSLADTLTTYVEMTDRGIRFGHISVAKSDATKFTVDPKTKEIIPPFSAVDSLGESMAQKIVEERKRKPFESVEDFVNRCHISAAINASLKSLGAYGDLPESAQMTLDEFM